MTLEYESEAGMRGAADVPAPAAPGGPRERQRPVRSRRYTRRSLIAGQRPQKRLFTPEIKRYLKDWLVRRRENPYPNRDEKKSLAQETGLTYIQICNWFANWRRKLKNVNMDRNQRTWGHLIRTYNDRAQGNVEQFSICSEDSIWSESELPAGADDSDGRSDAEPSAGCPPDASSGPLLLSRWLESAARFQPSENNYSWWGRSKPRACAAWPRHGRDEVEAAEALTALAAAAGVATH